MGMSTIRVNEAKKEAFMTKHNFKEEDMKNLARYEETRRSGAYNMNEWLIFMAQHNFNGGERLASWIRHNYKDYLDILE